jgi:hypothetical protein
MRRGFDPAEHNQPHETYVPFAPVLVIIALSLMIPLAASGVVAGMVASWDCPFGDCDCEAAQ